MSIGKKLWSLLTSMQRRTAIGLFGLMLVGMLMETLGIGLVIPALALMTQTDLTAKYPALAPWLQRIGNPSHERMVVTGMLVLVGAYSLKVLFLAFLAWRQSRFVYALQADLSQRLFKGYLLQPYVFHLQRNSAQLIRNTIGQVSDVANVVQQVLILTTEFLVLLGISILLGWIEPAGALLVMGVLGFAGWAFHQVTRGHILRWGKARQLHEGLRIQHLQQGLGGVKDLKLLGREEEFLAEYHQHNVGSAKVGQRQTTLIALPRLWLELLAAIGLAGLVLTMIAQSKPLDAILPTLGVFAAAAFRLMPSMNRVLAALQSMRFSLPMINTVHSELSNFQPRDAQHGPGLTLTRSLAIEHLNFYYPAVTTKALDEINLEIPKGSSVGFIGGSGAGKSTLVDTILGLLTPNDGLIKVDGVDIHQNLRAWQNQIGYVPQSIFLTDDTLRRNIAFGLPPDQINDAAVWRAIQAAQLEQYVSDLPEGLDTVVGERGVRLSGGQRQRIGIARALYHDPGVLVLDEATSSLDTDTERKVMDAVRAFKGEKTLLIVAHRLSTVEHCDYLFRLERGRVVDHGQTARILEKNLDGVIKV